MKDLFPDFDEQFREQLNDHRFPPLPQAWEDMQARLDARDRRKRWFLWYWVSGVLGAAALTFGVWYAYKLHETKQLYQAASAKNAPASSALHLFHPTNLSAASAQTAYPSGESPRTNSGLESNTANVAATNGTESSPQNTSAPRPELKPTQRKNPRALSGKRRNGQSAAPQPTPKRGQTAPSQSASGASPFAHDNSQRPSEFQPEQNQANPTAIELETANALVAEVPVENAQAEPLPQNIPSLDSEVAREPIAQIGAPKNQRWTFSLWAGLNHKIYAEASQYSITALAGLGVVYRTAPKHGFGIGVQTKSLVPKTGFFAPSLPGYTRTARDIDADAVALAGTNQMLYNRKATALFELRSFHFIEVPVWYEFSAGRRHAHRFQAGVKTSILTRASFQSNNPTDELHTKGLGFARVDVGAMIGYEARLSKRWSLGMTYSLGLRNLTKNVYKDREYTESYALQGLADATPTTDVDAFVSVRSVADDAALLRVPTRVYNRDFLLYMRYSF